MENKATVWAWGEYTDVDNDTKKLLEDSIWKDKKSRFGWSSDAKYDLRKEPTEEHPKQSFLLEIKEGDWIVHKNMPEKGRCTAVKVVSEYDFDVGIKSIHKGQEKIDFRHHLGVEPVIVFKRNDEVVSPRLSQSLKARGKCYKVKAVDDFFEAINKLEKRKEEKSLGEESKGLRFLRKKIKKEKLLSQISDTIYETHPSKALEGFLAEVFRKVPNVKNVCKNGFGFKSDSGADLIVEMNTLLLPDIEIKNKIIVQVKSFGGVFRAPKKVAEAVSQIKEGIKEFNGTIGIIATTAEGSENLKDKIKDASNEIGVPIFLLDAEDLAKFVIKYAPEMIGLNP